MAKTGMAIGARGARACDMCAKERARWYCAADEAYLCERCDATVHSANAVARRHERVKLGPNGAPVKLDRKSAGLSSVHRVGVWAISNKKHSMITKRSFARTHRHRHRTSKTDASTPVGNHDSHDLECQSTVQINKEVEMLSSNVHEHRDQGGSKDESIMASSSVKPMNDCQLAFYEELLCVKSEDESDSAHEVPAFEPLLHELIAASHGDLVEQDTFSGFSSFCSANSSQAVNELSDPSFLCSDKNGQSLQEGLKSDSSVVDERSMMMDDTSADIDTFDIMELCANASFEDDMLVTDELNLSDMNSDSWVPETCSNNSIAENHSGKTSRREQHTGCVDQEPLLQLDDEEQCPLISVPCSDPSINKKTLSLQLNYEEIIDAWSDKGSLWIYGQRPQVVPDGCFLEHGMTLDFGLLPESSCGSNSQATHVPVLSDVAREARVMRYKEKRRTRLFCKKIRYEVRKLNAERRPRMKGRFVKRSAITDMQRAN